MHKSRKRAQWHKHPHTQHSESLAAGRRTGIWPDGAHGSYLLHETWSRMVSHNAENWGLSSATPNALSRSFEQSTSRITFCIELFCSMLLRFVSAASAANWLRDTIFPSATRSSSSGGVRSGFNGRAGCELAASGALIRTCTGTLHGPLQTCAERS